MASYACPSNANITVGTSAVEVKVVDSHADVIVQNVSSGQLFVGVESDVEGASPSSGKGGIRLAQYETFSVRLMPEQYIHLLSDTASQDVRVFVTPASQ